MTTLGEYFADKYETEFNDILGDGADPIDTAVEVLKWFDANQKALRFLSGCGYKKVADWYTIIFKQQKILKDYANIERGINNMAKSMHPGFYKRLGTAEEIHRNTMSKIYERQYEELREEFENFIDSYNRASETIELVTKLWKDGVYHGVRHYLVDNIDAEMSYITGYEWIKKCTDLHERCVSLIAQRDNLALLRDHGPMLAGMADRLFAVSNQVRDLRWMKTCLELSFGCCGPID